MNCCVYLIRMDDFNMSSRCNDEKVYAIFKEKLIGVST